MLGSTVQRRKPQREDTIMGTATIRRCGTRQGTRALLLTIILTIAFSMLGPVNAYALSKGQTFKQGGNTYRIDDYDAADREGEVVLVTYGSTNTKPTINTVRHKGVTFEVETIGAGAFNTARGHRVTSVKIGKHVDRIKSHAFAGCKKLKTLNMRTSDVIELRKRGAGWIVDDNDAATGAFTGINPKVRVLCGSNSSKYRATYKKALTSRGMAPSATVAP